MFLNAFWLVGLQEVQVKVKHFVHDWILALLILQLILENNDCIVKQSNLLGDMSDRVIC